MRTETSARPITSRFSAAGQGMIPIAPLALMVMALLLPAGLGFAPAAHAAKHGPPRVGIVHPFPRFCLEQERSQRDVRLLRLAFRIPARQWGAQALPWYYKIHRDEENGSPHIYLTLDTESLWGIPLQALISPWPPSGEDALKPWRRLVMARIPGLTEAPFLSLAQFVAPAGQDFSFWRSRLGSSGALPYYSAFAGSETPCIRWPKDVTYTPGTRSKGYILLSRRQGAPYRLTAYLTLKAMLRDLQRGRLAAALMDGGELISAIEARMELPQPVVGRSAGTQQIVLKPRLELLDDLEPGAMRALSRAVPRSILAWAAGAEFMPSRAFFHAAGVTAPQGDDAPRGGRAPPKGQDPLAWDTRRARGNWLKLQNAPQRLTLAVLDHPLLRRVAETLASQWKKTLGLELEIAALPVQKFFLPGGAAAADFTLLVVDQDDGSLQNLWRAALAGRSPPAIELPAAELLLRKHLPYLPLIEDAHFLLATSPAAYRRTAHLCPGCEVRPLRSYRRRKRP